MFSIYRDVCKSVVFGKAVSNTCKFSVKSKEPHKWPDLGGNEWLLYSVIYQEPEKQFKL